jgi:hypothetical protein
MFLCKECHAKDACKIPFDQHPKSQGPCEGCEKVSLCADCPSWHAAAKADTRN